MALSPSMLALLEAQHAVAANEQLFALGLSWSGLRSHCKLGELMRLTPRVVRLAGSAATCEQRLTAAVLDVRADGAICRTSAASHWQLPGFRSEPIDVLVARPRGGKPLESSLAVVHYTRVLLDTHVVAHGGLRVTTPARTLFDLAATTRPERMAKLVDRAWSKGLVTHATLYRTLKELESRGRAGIVAMRDIIEERGPNHRPPDSNLEAHFQDLMKSNGVDGLRRQINSGSSSMWIGRVDFRHHRLALIIQIDSELYHSSISDQAKDDAETAALEAAGYVVVRVSEFDLWHNPNAVIEAVRAGVREARRRLAATSATELASAGGMRER